MKKLLCPECGEPLTGLKRKIELRIGVTYETEWLCESCDTEWVFLKGRGLTRADEYERLVDEEKIEYFPRGDPDAAVCRKPRKLGNVRGSR